MRRVLVLLLSIMFLGIVGCNVESGMDIPDLEVMYEGEAIEVMKGGYNWTTKSGLWGEESVIVDAASPQDIAKGMKGNRVPVGAKLDLVFSKKPISFKVVNWGEPGECELTAAPDTLTIPEEEGTYIIEVIGEWKEGQISYTFKINGHKNKD